MNVLKSMWNKTTRPIFIILVSAVFAFAAYMYYQKDVDKQVQTMQVWVAAVDIAPNTQITSDNISQVSRVVSAVPPDAITDIADLDLKNVYSSGIGFKPGDVIRQSYLTTAEDSKLGTVVALKDGMVEIGVATDLVGTAGNEVRAGMLVQVQAFLTQSAEGRGIVKADTDLTEILVRKVVNSEGYTPEAEEERSSRVPAVVTLEVTPTQAMRIMEYQQTGKVFLLPSGIKQMNP